MKPTLLNPVAHRKQCWLPPREAGVRLEPSSLWRSLRPLVMVSTALGVGPHRPRCCCLLGAASRAYSLAIALAVLCLCSMDAAFVAGAEVEQKRIAASASGFITIITITVTAALSILSSLAGSGDRFLSLVSEIERVDVLFHKRASRANSRTFLCLLLLAATLLTYYSMFIAFQVISSNSFAFVMVYVANCLTVFIVLQFTTLVAVLRHRFSLLNDTILRMSDNISVMQWNELSQLTNNRRLMLASRRTHPAKRFPEESITLMSIPILVDVRLAYMRLSKVAAAVNRMYGIPMVASALQTLTVSYHVIFCILRAALHREKADLFETLTDTSYVVVTLASFVCMAAACHSAAAQASRTATISDERCLTNSAGPEVCLQLRQLSRQARHSPVSFSACHLFTVDGHLLTAMAATIASYTIILLQFVS
ncbi:uncharacterized protein LOC126263307 [Schistocerca nitens]|uniref:uncharacterized protein LOC126263307 n=1 Tax=Schistocerca nitens TaxID=7011 RepID=UPI0021191EB2|nr:uncharacterized protein LOC126263307 [Schistocerca nitens]